jgi:Fe-S-cluster containining protein
MAGSSQLSTSLSILDQSSRASYDARRTDRLSTPRVFSLSFHSRYRCRHAGACCTSNWPIPIEADRLSAVRAAMTNGVLVGPKADADSAFGDLTDAAALVGVSHGACVFYERERGGTCAIHRTLGHDALPLACRQFPRVSVRDPRGVSVTLSHYCPTAASLLAASDAMAIVTDSSAFPATSEYVGLDATTSPPPLLRPGVLMDWETWWDVERRAVALFARDDRAPEASLDMLSEAIERARGWRPSDGPLVAHIARAFDDVAEGRGLEPPRSQRWLDARRALALDAVPRDLTRAIPPFRLSSAVGPSAPALARFLAAHVFASWTPHLGGGLRAWVRSVEVACALATTSGVRDADLVLRHLIDPREFAARCASAEREHRPAR